MTIVVFVDRSRFLEDFLAKRKKKNRVITWRHRRVSRIRLYLLRGKFASSNQLFLFLLSCLYCEKNHFGGRGGKRKTKRLVNAFIKLTLLTEFIRFLLICVYINILSR